MFMQKDENDNAIYGDLNEANNLKVKFYGKNNVLFLAGQSFNVNVNFLGDNGVVFIGKHTKISDRIDVSTNSLCYIGDMTWINGAVFRVFESKNVIIGNYCVISWNTFFGTCDQHIIYDNKTNLRQNESKSIYMGDHCWLAQDSGLLKGAFMASGSILGAKSLGRKTLFSNSLYAGSPCKEIKSGIFWAGVGFINYTKTQSEQTKHLPKDDFKFAFEKECFLSPLHIEKALENLQSSGEKLKFLYEYIYTNRHKNRFALFANSNTTQCGLYKSGDFANLSFEPVSFSLPETIQTKEQGQMEDLKNLYREHFNIWEN